MKPISFPGCNAVYAKDQPEYLPLPVYRSDTVHGQVVSCWKLSFIERLKLLITGKLWLSVFTFRGPLQPVLPTTKKNEVLIEMK